MALAAAALSGLQGACHGHAKLDILIKNIHTSILLTGRIPPLQDQITQLILQRFDRFTENSPVAAPEPAPTAAAPLGPVNGIVKSVEKSPSDSAPSSPKKRATSDPDEDESALSSPVETPPKKKQRKAGSGKRVEEDDAAFAKRLQAEENMRARSTRGGGSSTKKRPPVKNKVTKKKAKSAKKVKSDDDSDVDSGTGAEKEAAKKKGGFHVCFPIPLSLHLPLRISPRTTPHWRYCLHPLTLFCPS